MISIGELDKEGKISIHDKYRNMRMVPINGVSLEDCQGRVERLLEMTGNWGGQGIPYGIDDLQKYIMKDETLKYDKIELAFRSGSISAPWNANHNALRDALSVDDVANADIIVSKAILVTSLLNTPNKDNALIILNDS